MKVIKKGRDQKSWSKEFTCTGRGNGGGGCGAILLVSKDDIYDTSFHYHDEISRCYNTFTCPCCQVETNIKDLPFGVTQTKEEMLKKLKK